MNIDFSIVIPTYNNLDLLKKALLSALVQKNVEIEIIIVDDSVDTVIEEYINFIDNIKVRYFHNTPSRGAVKNWNYGLSLAKGDFVILLHHDESFLNEDYLSRCFVIIKKNNSEIVISNVKVVFQDNIARSNQKSLMLKKIVCHVFPEFLYLFNLIGPTATIMIRRNCINNFDNNLVMLVDVDWYIKLIRDRKISFMLGDNICSVYGHKDQISMNINRDIIRRNDELYISNKMPYMSILFYLKRVLMLFIRNRNKRNNIIWG